MKVIANIFPPENILKRLEYAIQHNQTRKQKYFADQLDMFEFHYRGYLAGFHKTLHMVFWLIKHHEDVDLNIYKSAVLSIIEDIEKHILEVEAYEFMNKHLKAKAKIIKLFNTHFNALP